MQDTERYGVIIPFVKVLEMRLQREVYHRGSFADKTVLRLSAILDEQARAAEVRKVIRMKDKYGYWHQLTVGDTDNVTDLLESSRQWWERCLQWPLLLWGRRT